MSIKRPLASAAFLVCLAIATVAAPSVALAGTATPSLATTTFPQTAAAQQGATSQEVAEMLGVTVLMNGGPATVWGPRAYSAFEEWASAAPGGEGTPT